MSFPYSFPRLLAGDASELTVASHAEAAIRRLAQYLRGDGVDPKPNVGKVLAALAASADELEAVFIALLEDRTIEEATGAQLDVLGAIIGQARGNLTDDADYRPFVKARAYLNRSSGAPNEILGLFQILDAGGETRVITDELPAGFVLIFGGVALSSDKAFTYLQLLRAAHPGGVRAVMEWSEADSDDTFTLDGSGDQVLDLGLFAGATE